MAPKNSQEELLNVTNHLKLKHPASATVPRLTAFKTKRWLEHQFYVYQCEEADLHWKVYLAPAMSSMRSTENCY